MPALLIIRIFQNMDKYINLFGSLKPESDFRAYMHFKKPCLAIPVKKYYLRTSKKESKP